MDSTTKLKKFYLIVKKNISEILIVTDTYLTFEMECVDDEAEEKIFNGSIPLNLYDNAKLILLNDSLETEYTFENLFSLPFDYDNKNHKNFIVVNTPFEIKYVYIEVPKYFQDTLQLPKIISLLNVQDLKINLFPEGSTNKKKLAHGIDPQARNFIRSVELENKWDIDQKKEFIVGLNEYKFTVKCFTDFIIKDIKLE